MLTDKDEKDDAKLVSLVDMYKNYRTKYRYVGNIFLRIGIAVSENPGIKYYFNNMESYRGSVIRLAEKAEEMGPFLTGYGEYVDGKIISKLNVGHEMNLVLTKKDIQSRDNQYKYTPVSGFILFVHYKMTLTEKLLRENKHIYENVRDEFRTLHDITVNSMDTIGGYLVKIKRDSSSMYYIPRQSKFKEQRVNIWDECSKLLSLLPSKSSIGIAYGEKEYLTEVTKKRGNMVTKDYFGAVVNIAARMASVDFSYSTIVGDTAPSSHLNRIAYADMNRSNIVDILEPKGDRVMTTNTAAFIPYPYTVDRVPIVKINVGYSGFVYVLSKHLLGKTEFSIGRSVKWMSGKQERRGTIVEIGLSEALIQWNDRKIWVPMRLLELDTNDAAVREEINKMFAYKLKF